MSAKSVKRVWDEWNALPTRARSMWWDVITPDNNFVLGAMREIRAGERTLYIEDPNEHDAEMAARSAMRVLRASRWASDDYVCVDSPMKVECEPGVWVMCLSLDERGFEMLEATEQGLVWNPNEHAVDEKATLAFWRTQMRGGVVEHATFARVARLTHPMLKVVVKEFTVFRLMAERDGLYWRAPRDQVAMLLGDHP